jgi:5-methylcytosine-specific restriction endonuclease McrBC regulatory subunit McrC
MNQFTPECIRKRLIDLANEVLRLRRRVRQLEKENMSEKAAQRLDEINRLACVARTLRLDMAGHLCYYLE